jgi:hypothetical protein
VDARPVALQSAGLYAGSTGIFVPPVRVLRNLTNLVGGWVASRTGLRFTLVVGLGLQVVALGGDDFLPLSA